MTRSTQKGFTLYPAAKQFRGMWIPMIMIRDSRGRQCGARCHKAEQRDSNMFSNRVFAEIMARTIAWRLVRRFPATRVAPMKAAIKTPSRQIEAGFYGLRAVAIELNRHVKADSTIVRLVAEYGV